MRGDQNSDDDSRFEVVVNHEEQYSIWPEGREMPLGWKVAGKAGLKSECLAYIDQVWTDMRPLSLRQAMQDLAENPPPAEPEASTLLPPDPRDNLVGFLSDGDHPVQATAQSVEQFLERIKTGFVHIKFTDTRGGTEIGVRLDAATSDTTHADLDARKGNVRIAGNLTLNYQPLRLVADVALDTLMGTGHFELQETRA